LNPDITVGEFIDRLSAYNRDAVLRLAINPDFPFAHFVGDLVEGQDDQSRPAVFLGEAGQQSHLPLVVAQSLGWLLPTGAPARTRRRATRASD
jgi:hypothetical protein